MSLFNIIMVMCGVCEMDLNLDEEYYFTDDLGEEYVLCRDCFEKMLESYRLGSVLMIIYNNEDTIELWFDKGTYVLLIYSKHYAVVDEITF